MYHTVTVADIERELGAIIAIFAMSPVDTVATRIRLQANQLALLEAVGMLDPLAKQTKYLAVIAGLERWLQGDRVATVITDTQQNFILDRLVWLRGNKPNIKSALIHDLKQLLMSLPTYIADASTYDRVDGLAESMTRIGASRATCLFQTVSFMSTVTPVWVEFASGYRKSDMDVIVQNAMDEFISYVPVVTGKVTTTQEIKNRWG